MRRSATLIYLTGHLKAALLFTSTLYVEWQRLHSVNQHSSTAEKYSLLTFPLIKLDILPIFLIML